MKIKTEIMMDGLEFMGKFYDHYIAERWCAEEFMKCHTMEDGHWDNELVSIISSGADIKNNDFRLAFEEFAGKKGKINSNYPKNLVAFVLTMEYFGMKNIEILS